MAFHTVVTTRQRAKNCTTSRDVTSPYRDEHTVDGVRTTKVRRDGTIRVRKTEFCIGARYAGQTAYVLATDRTVEFFDHQGTSVARCPWPLPGIRYVGVGQLRPS